jgi:hypothetical protein
VSGSSPSPGPRGGPSACDHSIAPGRRCRESDSLTSVDRRPGRARPLVPPAPRRVMPGHVGSRRLRRPGRRAHREVLGHLALPVLPGVRGVQFAPVRRKVPTFQDPSSPWRDSPRPAIRRSRFGPLRPARSGPTTVVDRSFSPVDPTRTRRCSMP